MSALAVSDALSEVSDNSVDGALPARRQRVRVPMRLVCSPSYQDVALAVYVKVKVARPYGVAGASS